MLDAERITAAFSIHSAPSLIARSLATRAIAMRNSGVRWNGENIAAAREAKSPERREKVIRLSAGLKRFDSGITLPDSSRVTGSADLMAVGSSVTISSIDVRSSASSIKMAS